MTRRLIGKTINGRGMHSLMRRRVSHNTGMGIEEALELVLQTIRYLEYGVMPVGFEWNDDIAEACGVCDSVLTDIQGEQL